MTDYTKLKVIELKDVLHKRSLPTTGNKPELIARLQAADKESTPNASATTTTAPATQGKSATTEVEKTQQSKGGEKKAAHLPSAADYEVDWDNDEEPAATTSETAAVKESTLIIKAAPSSATVSVPTPTESCRAAVDATSTAPVSTTAAVNDQRPKRRTIASLFDDPPASSLTTSAKKPAIEPSSPSTVTDDPKASTPKEKLSAVEPIAELSSFAANLPSTSLDDEIARRKKRAERFGLSVEESETLKALERQKRFGAAVSEDKGTTAVRGLDEALPEHQRNKRRRDNEGPGAAGAGGRGGKRGRIDGRDRRLEGNGHRNHNHSMRSGGGPTISTIASGRVQKRIADDPEERKKAEQRRRRFADAV